MRSAAGRIISCTELVGSGVLSFTKKEGDSIEAQS